MLIYLIYPFCAQKAWTPLDPKEQERVSEILRCEKSSEVFAISEVASHFPRLANIAVHGGPHFATRMRSVEMDSSPWPQRQPEHSARTEGLRLGAKRKLRCVTSLRIP